MAKINKFTDTSDDGATKRNQPRGEKRFRDLVDTATELFIRKGVSETTIDDIVSQAGIAKGTFYHHFDSKAALLIAIKETVMQDFEKHVANELAVVSTDDPVRRLNVWVRAFCEAYAMMVPRQDIAFVSDGYRWSPRHHNHLIKLVDLLKQGNIANCWFVEDLYTTAIFIEKALVGIMDDMILTGSQVNGPSHYVMNLVNRLVGVKNK